MCDHMYVQNRQVNNQDCFLFFGMDYIEPRRICALCGKEQIWEPGTLGISEDKWIDIRHISSIKCYFDGIDCLERRKIVLEIRKTSASDNRS